MDVTRLQQSADFDSVREAWQDLARGEPMAGWHWNSAWWTHYGHARAGGKRELLALVVSDGGRIVAIAPWLVDPLPARGRVIRFLGEDEVCTDYPSILCRDADRPRATQALADYLVNEFDAWDVLELSGVRADDATTSELVAQLAELGHSKFSRQVIHRCWKFALPSSWDEHVQRLSKNTRLKMRKLQARVVEAGRLAVHRVTDASEFDAAWDVLVDLHQRRRQSLGQPGCFSSPRFAAFHSSVARELLKNRQLGLAWFELDGRPLSAEYTLIGPDTTYTYQGGMEPDLLHEQPGHLGFMHTIQWAIADGHQTYNFLRGDEPYKAQWRAEPEELYSIRVVADRSAAQLREAAFQAVGNLKGWLKARWRRVRETAPGACAS